MDDVTDARGEEHEQGKDEDARDDAVERNREVLRAEQESAAVFFLQAEDGIRDLTVTGVQTCALPIFFDATDIANPRHLADVQTCRGSHTHTVVTSPTDTDNVYIYVSGSAPVRSPNELPGCSLGRPDSNPNTALFRIEVIRVPLAHPEQARVVSSPRIFQDLTEAPTHPAAAQALGKANGGADSARAGGGLTAKIKGPGDPVDIVRGPGFIHFRPDSIVKARGGPGPPPAADTAPLRANAQQIVDLIVNPPNRGPGPRPGPTQCHDITVYPAIGLAGGACGGYGLLLDIPDPPNPRRTS